MASMISSMKFWSFLIFIFLSILVRDWAALVPPTVALAGVGYVSYLAICPHARPKPKAERCNHNIRLSEAKVADFVDIEDIAEKAAFCRCWQSKNVSKTIVFCKPIWRNRLLISLSSLLFNSSGLTAMDLTPITTKRPETTWAQWCSNARLHRHKAPSNSHFRFPV